MKKSFSSIQKQVWAMHLDGMPMSEIAAKTRLDTSFVHATITSVWREGGTVD